jgi:hypothetical protein
VNPKSANALTWLALIVNLMGLVVTTGGGQFMGAALAILLTLPPTIVARKGPQLFAGLVLVGSAALAVSDYGEFTKFQTLYRSVNAGEKLHQAPSK